MLQVHLPSEPTLHHPKAAVIIIIIITMQTSPNHLDFVRLPPKLSIRHPPLTFLLLLLLPQGPAGRSLELPRILSRHARFVPSAFAAFPEAVAFFADEPLVAEAAVFGTVVLFAGTCEGKSWLAGRLE
jgi:hypothetical protein